MPGRPHVVRLRHAEPIRLHHYLLLGVLLCLMLAATIIIQQFVQVEEGIVLRVQAQAEAAQLSRRLHQAVERQLEPIRDLRRRWEAGDFHSDDELSASARSTLEEWPFCQLISAADADGRCRWTRTSPVYADLEPELVTQTLQFKALAAKASQSEREAAVVSVGGIEHRPVLLVAIPPLAELSASAPGSTVLMVQLTLLDTLSNAIGSDTRREHSIELRDAKGTVLLAGPSDSRGESYGDVQPVRAVDTTWHLRLWPNDAAISGRMDRLGALVLISGIPLSMLFTGALWRIMLHRSRQIRETQIHLAALESLNEISAAISAQLGAGRQVLDQLADSARRLLRMSRSGIALLDGQKQLLNVVAVSGDVAPQAPISFRVADLPSARGCIETGQILFAGNSSHAAVQINRDVANEFNATATILIPLQIEGQCIGVMAISDSHRREFTDADRRLASLLGSQAAVILANNRLYQQTLSMLQQQKSLLEQQERLYAVNAAVYQAPTFEGSLQAITELAPAALGVDLCTVNLIDESGQELVVAAATGEFAPLVKGKRFAIANNNAGTVLRTRQLLVIEDGPSDPTLHPVFRDVLRVGSIIYLPLARSDQKILGLLTLVRHAPGPVTEAQRNLAQVFASRAAAAMENALLNEQTRRDAQTQAILLRELHHRVKNNLAGIVGLLSMDQPELPPSARQWLDRVVDRIQTMAGTYDLFKGGADMIDLRQLIEQVLPSLSVIAPPGVLIRTDVDGAGYRFPAPQAVSLAMVLHELCTNAIQHGLGQQGTLSIRVRSVPRGLAIDVMDDGRGPPEELMESFRPDTRGPAEAGSLPPWQIPPAGAAAGHRGIGLRLVEQLVGRELRGTFHMRRSPQGLTIATVEFPLSGSSEGVSS